MLIDQPVPQVGDSNALDAYKHKQPDAAADVMAALVDLINEMQTFFRKLSLQGYDDIYEQCVSMLTENIQINYKQLADVPKQIFDDLQSACFGALTILTLPTHNQSRLIVSKSCKLVAN
jgi:hypothetical protein